jgi:DNA-binding transcriptional regulator Cro
MKIEDVMMYFGSARGMERKIGISHASMKNWRDRGYIPIETQVRIQRLTEDALMADLSHCNKVEDAHTK